MLVLIGVLVVLFIVAVVLAESRWGERRRARWNDTATTGSVVGGDWTGGGPDCSGGGGSWGGGDFGGGGGDGGGGG